MNLKRKETSRVFKERNLGASELRDPKRREEEEVSFGGVKGVKSGWSGGI